MGGSIHSSDSSNVSFEWRFGSEELDRRNMHRGGRESVHQKHAFAWPHARGSLFIDIAYSMTRPAEKLFGRVRLSVDEYMNNKSRSYYQL
jgi:hypothetical protein